MEEPEVVKKGEETGEGGKTRQGGEEEEVEEAMITGGINTLFRC